MWISEEFGGHDSLQIVYCFLPHQLVRFLQILCRDGRIQLPCDAHRPAALVLYVVRNPKECIGGSPNGIRLEFPNEEEHLTSLLPMVDVPLSGSGCLCRSALTLPVEQGLIDGVILIHCGGGIVFVSFVQRHEEHIQLLLRQPLYSFAHGGGLQKVQRYKQLVAGSQSPAPPDGQ